MAMYKGTKLIGSSKTKKTLTPAAGLNSAGPRTTDRSKVGRKSMSAYGGNTFPRDNTYTMAVGKTKKKK